MEVHSLCAQACTSMHVHACVHTYTESHIRTSHESSILHMSTCISLFTIHVHWSPDVALASSCTQIHTYTHASLYVPHTLHAPTKTAMLRSIHPHVACATHHNPHFPAYPIHPPHTHTHSPSSYTSHPQ